MATVQIDILPRIRISIDWHRVLQGSRILLAGVSGGPDSMALADGLYRLGEEMDFHIVLAHYNHGIRGDDAERDQKFVKTFASDRNIDCEVGLGDVTALSEETGLSIEMAARKLRYGFFEKIALKHNCRFLALGHNADDQVENLLLRLFRGSGGQGLGSLQPVRESGGLTLIRPMLPIFRKEILSYLEWRNLDYRVDSTNLETTTDRGKIRNVILPAITDTLVGIGWANPLEAMARSASLLAEDESLFNDIVSGFFTEIRSDENRVTLPMASLNTVHPAILGRLVLRAVQNLDPDVRPDRNHVDRVTMMLMGVKVGALDLPGGISAEVDGGNVIIHRPLETVIPDPISVSPEELPATVEFDRSILKIKIESPEKWLEFQDSRIHCGLKESHGVVWLAIPEGLTGITIRGVEPGDRMEPLGMDGHTKKIQDIFVDTGIPREERRLEPMVVFEMSGTESIIAAIPGMGLISEKVKIEPATERVILISVKRK